MAHFQMRREKKKFSSSKFTDSCWIKSDLCLHIQDLLSEQRLLYWIWACTLASVSVCTHLSERVIVYMGQRLNKSGKCLNIGYILEHSNRAVVCFGGVNTAFFLVFCVEKKKTLTFSCRNTHKPHENTHALPLSYIPQWDLACHILSQLLEAVLIRKPAAPLLFHCAALIHLLN